VITITILGKNLNAKLVFVSKVEKYVISLKNDVLQKRTRLILNDMLTLKMLLDYKKFISYHTL